MRTGHQGGGSSSNCNNLDRFSGADVTPAQQELVLTIHINESITHLTNEQKYFSTNETARKPPNQPMSMF